MNTRVISDYLPSHNDYTPDDLITKSFFSTPLQETKQIYLFEKFDQLIFIHMNSQLLSL